MRFALKNIYVKAKWFEDEKSKINKIGCEGYFLYLNLFKFLIPNQEHKYTFITSLSLIRKETGFTTQQVYDLLKLLIKQKIIDTNVSRWDRMFDGSKLLDDKTIMIYGIDVPNTYRKENEKGVVVDVPVTSDDIYISVNLEMMQHYIDIGLNEKYCALYSLIRKLSSGNLERKSWMSINNMADILGVGDNYLNHMIYDMNRKYLLASYYRGSTKKVIKKGKKVSGKSFEHHLLVNVKYRDQWIKANQEQIEKNIRKWDKAKDRKSKDKIDEIDDEADEQVPEDNYKWEDEMEFEESFI